jgi:hypothetical protein
LETGAALKEPAGLFGEFTAVVVFETDGVRDDEAYGVGAEGKDGAEGLNGVENEGNERGGEEVCDGEVKGPEGDLELGLWSWLA